MDGLRGCRKYPVPTEIHDGHLRGLLDSEFGDHVMEQSEHPVCGEFEAVHVEDLRTDVTVQAHQTQVVGGEHATHRVHRHAPARASRTSTVLVRGRDEFVGVGLDSDGDADQHVGHGSRSPASTSSRSISVIESTTMSSTPASRASIEFGRALVVAVEGDSFGQEPRAQRDGQLAAGANVDGQSC